MRELATMQERMNRILSAPYGRDQEDSTHRGAWTPLVDIYENGDRELVIKADAPGLKREDIDLTFDSNVLPSAANGAPTKGSGTRRITGSSGPYGPFSGPSPSRRRSMRDVFAPTTVTAS